MVKSVVIIGIFILLLIQSVSAGEQIEKKTGKSRVIFVKKYECQPFTILIPEHPTSAVAVIANQGIIIATWDSLSEYHLSLYDFSGALLRSVKHSWGFPTHLYYNTDRKRLYFWHTSFPHNTISRSAYVMDTNLALIDSFSVSSFPDWFIKVGMLQSNRQAGVEKILKKIRKIAGVNGYGYAEKDMWRYVSFISKRYVLCQREVGNSGISGYDISKKTAFKFDIQDRAYSQKDSISLNSETCEGTRSLGNRKLSGGISGVAISEKEFIIATFNPYSSADCFRQVLLDEE